MSAWRYNDRVKIKGDGFHGGCEGRVIKLDTDVNLTGEDSMVGLCYGVIMKEDPTNYIHWFKAEELEKDSIIEEINMSEKVAPTYIHGRAYVFGDGGKIKVMIEHGSFVFRAMGQHMTALNVKSDFVEVSYIKKGQDRARFEARTPEGEFILSCYISDWSPGAIG